MAPDDADRPALDPAGRGGRHRLVRHPFRNTRGRDAPLAIAFGAVDGYCDVFVDGSKVGEQKLAPEIMWNRPFHLPLEKRLSAGTHTLVIRVEKKCGTDSNAGIYLPVWVVEDHGRDRCAAPEP